MMIYMEFGENYFILFKFLITIITDLKSDSLKTLQKDLQYFPLKPPKLF